MGIHGMNLLQILLFEYLDIANFGFTPVTVEVPVTPPVDSGNTYILTEDSMNITTEAGMRLITE